MRRGIRGRRKSGYGHTTVQQIIIGLVRQHLLWQHSSRQPRGPKTRLRSSELFRQTDTRADTGRILSLRGTSSNPCLPCCSGLDHCIRLTMTSDLPGVFMSSEDMFMCVCRYCMSLNDSVCFRGVPSSETPILTSGIWVGFVCQFVTSYYRQYDNFVPFMHPLARCTGLLNISH